MKELSIEEKAYDSNYKTYTELINRLEGVKDAIKKQNYGIAMDILCKPYPEYQIITSTELKESEDERIRKAIKLMYSFLPNEPTYIGDVPVKDIFAWLEKQGKKDEEILILKDQIESLHAAIKAIKETHRIELEKQGEQKPTIEMKTPEESLGIDSDTYNKIVDECIYGEQEPADKSEPKFKVGDIIRRKATHKDMQVSRVESNYYLCNHLGKFSSESISFSEESNYELVEQKPADTEKGENGNEREIPNSAWSEEDILILDDTLYFIKEYQRSNRCIDENRMQNSVTCEKWLKSLKDRVLPQPKQEWSEEDYNEIETIACHLDNIDNEGMAEVLRNIRDKYYSQSNWKPSDEQIDALESAVSLLQSTTLESLYNELKKLREE